MSNATLELADEVNLKNELNLGLREPTSERPVAPEVLQRAEAVAAKILAVDPAQTHEADQAKAAVASLGAEIQSQAALSSKMLDQPLNELMARGDDGGEVAKSLIDLKMTVDELDPANFDFSSNAFLRLLGKIPGVGTPMKRYFSRYQSSGVVIEGIVDSLHQGKDQLKRDNITLAGDQQRMRELTRQLEQTIALGQTLDARLSEQIETTIPSDDPRYQFLNEEVIFPLRQRIQDLQQQLLVNQQGILTMEVIMRNNKELIRGVQRSVDVTVNALRIAVTLAVALANQEIVLNKIKAVNETTENLLAGNARRLKQQAVDIHKDASSAKLDIDKLQSAFKDIRDALEAVSEFRQKALPQMANNIQTMEKMTGEQEAQIEKMEYAKKAKASIQEDFQIEFTD